MVFRFCVILARLLLDLLLPGGRASVVVLFDFSFERLFQIWELACIFLSMLGRFRGNRSITGQKVFDRFELRFIASFGKHHKRPHQSMDHHQCKQSHLFSISHYNKWTRFSWRIRDQATYASYDMSIIGFTWYLSRAHSHQHTSTRQTHHTSTARQLTEQKT